LQSIHKFFFTTISFANKHEQSIATTFAQNDNYGKLPGVP